MVIGNKNRENLAFPILCSSILGIVMMEVMKINVIVIYFLVNVTVNQVNSIVVVQMLRHQILYVFHDHFNVMDIMIVLIDRMKSVVVRINKF
jgi:hypothetical protein